MKSLRWLKGDFVKASFDDTTSQWTVSRVSDRSGNKLSEPGSRSPSAIVKFRIEEQTLPALLLKYGDGYSCSLAHSESECAVFVID